MNLEKLNHIQKWYADYLDEPFYPYEFSFWQYSESAIIDGVPNKCDLNLQFVHKSN